MYLMTSTNITFSRNSFGIGQILLFRVDYLFIDNTTAEYWNLIADHHSFMRISTPIQRARL